MQKLYNRQFFVVCTGKWFINQIFTPSMISTKHPQSSIAIVVDPNIAFINVLPQDWVEGGIRLVLELTPWMGVLNVKPFFICTYYRGYLQNQGT